MGQVLNTGFLKLVGRSKPTGLRIIDGHERNLIPWDKTTLWALYCHACKNGGVDPNSRNEVGVRITVEVIERKAG